MNTLNFNISSVLKMVVLISGALFFSNTYAKTSSGSHDGGLMKQMMDAKFPPKVISDPVVQARLSKVVIPEGSRNGGLMKQMMAAKYRPQVISDPVAQARLHKVIIAETGHQNGGLMKQMMRMKNSEL